MTTPSLEVIRETDWVRVWRTSEGEVVDSKYRTYECEASADQFILAWERCSVKERSDMKSAVTFFPYSHGIRRIVQFVCSISSLEEGQAIEEQWFGNFSMLPPHTMRFLLAFRESPHATSNRRLVCDTKWFRAYWNTAEFAYETDGKCQERPSYLDYCHEYVRAVSRLQRDVLSLYWGLPRES